MWKVHHPTHQLTECPVSYERGERRYHLEPVAPFGGIKASESAIVLTAVKTPDAVTAKGEFIGPRTAGSVPAKSTESSSPGRGQAMKRGPT